MTDHTHTEKIGGDSIFIFVVIQVATGNRYDTYQEFIKKMIEQFEDIIFKYLPREENYLEDALATLATMFKVNANAEAQLVKLKV